MAETAQDRAFAQPDQLQQRAVLGVRLVGGGIARPVSPAVGLALMALYAAVALVVGAVLFVRRDA